PAPLIGLNHPPHRATAKDVQVEMRNLLHAMGTGIGNGTETLSAVQRHTQIARHPRHRPVEIHDLGIRGIGRKVVIADIGAFWDHQHMHRRLRTDVTKDQRMSGLQHGVVRDLSTQDAGKYVVVVIGGHPLSPQSLNRSGVLASISAVLAGTSRKRASCAAFSSAERQGAMAWKAANSISRNRSASCSRSARTRGSSRSTTPGAVSAPASPTRAIWPRR